MASMIACIGTHSSSISGTLSSTILLTVSQCDLVEYLDLEQLVSLAEDCVGIIGMDICGII